MSEIVLVAELGVTRVLLLEKPFENAKPYICGRCLRLSWTGSQSWCPRDPAEFTKACFQILKREAGALMRRAVGYVPEDEHRLCFRCCTYS